MNDETKEDQDNPETNHQLPTLARFNDLSPLQTGKFCGAMPEIRWSELLKSNHLTRLWNFFHHKRWQYVALSSEDFFCAVAVVDLGWANTAFAFVFDKNAKKEIASFSVDGIPGASVTIGDTIGRPCSFNFLSTSVQMDRVNGQFVLRVSAKEFNLEAQFEFPQEQSILSVIGTVQHESTGKTSFHSTQKSSAFRFTGQLSVADQHYVLRNGLASFDYSNGLLPRRTEWLWASAHGLNFGINLQDGYFSDQENALWINGEIISLSRAKFEFNPENPRLPWHLSTEDGLLDLHFHVAGIHAENKNRLIASSHYIQAIGHFSGSIKSGPEHKAIRIDGLAGVTEHHRALW